MTPLPTSTEQSARIKRYALLISVIWTVAVAAFAVWALYSNAESGKQAAYIEAKATFEKDLVYRRWASMHGGVYIPVTEDAAPNPYLDVPNRDVVTTDGLVLTLMNPAYMTRQVHELEAERYGVKGHITSLNPIRPANAPDEWETTALQAFETGDQEVYSIETVDGEPTLRYMHPMITEESCLKCHADQGYELGDVRGGISVSVPMQPYWDARKLTRNNILMGQGTLWLFGLGGIVLSMRRILVGAAREANATQRLSESETRFRLLAENAHDIVYRMQVVPENRLEYVSPSVKAIIGYSPQEYYDRPDLMPTLFYPEQPEEIEQSTKLIRWAHRNGGIIWLERKTTPIFDETGTLAAVEGIIRDITERKQMEEALAASEAHLKSIIETQTAFVLRTDLTGRYTYVNDAFYSRFVWMYPSRPEMIGTDSMLTVIEADRPKVHEVVQQCITNPGQIVQLQLRKPCEDGTFFWSFWEFLALKDTDGVINEIQCVGIDVTERKQAEQREFELTLEKERRQLLTTFLQNAAHEFRTPLTTISSSAYLMSRIHDDDRLIKKSQQIDANVQRIANLLDMLMLMASLESDTTLLDKSFVNINMVVEEVHQGMVDTYHHKEHQYRMALSDLLPVLGDKSYLANALKQIIENAHRFTPAGGAITIRTQVVEDEVCIDVEDTGPGMSQDALSHIFDTFWRQDVAHSTPGFGLGLPIARKIIEHHGGQIQVQSIVDHGTHFRIVLPAIIEEEYAHSRYNQDSELNAR